MKYYTALTEDEVRDVCLAYPYKDLINGFKKCSKEFSALMPGRRPQSVSEEVGRNLIANNLRSTLTSKMVEALLSTWIPQIAESVTKQLEDGRTKDLAYIFAFSQYSLPGCIKIYFRLSDERFTEDRILAICAGVDALSLERERVAEKAESTAALKQIKELQKQHTKELKEKEREIKHKATEIKDISIELSRKKEEIEYLSEENQKIEKLQQLLSVEVEKVKGLEAEKIVMSGQFSELQALCKETGRKVHELNSEKNAVQAQLDECRSHLTELEFSKKALLKKIYRDTIEELRPADMDEFGDYLSYNLKCIGINSTKSYFSLLLNFLLEVLFLNKPIICNQALGHTLARCVSNALCGDPNPLVIPFAGTINSDDIRAMLEMENRIVVLDSFIGNFNEMELLPILKGVKSKIIFITAEYDKTLAYLFPEEVLCNCTYINANRIPELLLMNAIDEDPSTMSEELVMPPFEKPDTRMQRLCKEIMNQLGFPTVVTETYSIQMTSEEKLIQYLAFSLLPYCQEVFQNSPYNLSERLSRYAGPTGKCSHKKLLMEWFGDE